MNLLHSLVTILLTASFAIHAVAKESADIENLNSVQVADDDEKGKNDENSVSNGDVVALEDVLSNVLRLNPYMGKPELSKGHSKNEQALSSNKKHNLAKSPGGRQRGGRKAKPLKKYVKANPKKGKIKPGGKQNNIAAAVLLVVADTGPGKKKASLLQSGPQLMYIYVGYNDRKPLIKKTDFGKGKGKGKGKDDRFVPLIADMDYWIPEFLTGTKNN